MLEQPTLPPTFLPPDLVSDMVAAARARNMAKGDAAAILSRLERMASDLFPGESGFFRALFTSRKTGKTAGAARSLGERFWRTAFPSAENRRMDGSFYTPVPVIDRILDAVCPELLESESTNIPPLPICDPAMGCGFFPLRLIERLLARHGRRSGRVREWAAACLFGVDIDPAAVFVTRVGLWLTLSDGKNEFLPDPEHFRVGDSLLGRPFAGPAQVGGAGLDWPGAFPAIARAGGFARIFGNPPYEVLTNFSRHPQRRALARALRDSGGYRDSLAGQINLYRCFIERSLDLLATGGKLSFVVPLSLARDASALPLRRRLVEKCAAATWMLFGEQDRLFPGVTQSACIFVATRGGGPAEKLSVESGGKKRFVRLSTIKKYTGNALTIRNFAKIEESLLTRIWKICPDSLSEAAEMRVGEVDQTFFRDCMADADTGVILARGAHLSPFKLDLSTDNAKERFLELERFLERKGASAEGCRERAATWRVAQLGIRNMATSPRLVAALVPPGVYLGNSLNVYTPRAGLPLEYLAGILNSRLLDWLFRLASGNNNINLHEMRRLPFPLSPSPADVDAVVGAYRACAAAAESGRDPSPRKAALDDAVEKCYGVGADAAALFADHRGKSATKNGLCPR